MIPSSIVSGSCSPSVSGNNSVNTPASTDAAPKTTNGTACPTCPPTDLAWMNKINENIYYSVDAWYSVSI